MENAFLPKGKKHHSFFVSLLCDCVTNTSYHATRENTIFSSAPWYAKMAVEAVFVDMDELGFFLFMEEQERKENEEQEESSNGEG